MTAARGDCVACTLACSMHIGPGLGRHWDQWPKWPNGPLVFGDLVCRVLDRTFRLLGWREDRRLGWSGSSSGMWSGVCVLGGRGETSSRQPGVSQQVAFGLGGKAQITQRKDRLVARWLGITQCRGTQLRYRTSAVVCSSTTAHFVFCPEAVCREKKILMILEPVT